MLLRSLSRLSLLILLRDTIRLQKLLQILLPRKSLKYLGFEWELPDLGFIKLYFAVNGLERSRPRSIAMRFSLAGAFAAARLDLIFGLTLYYLIQKTVG